MAFASFREFITKLDQAGELTRISQPVATELEITELADREMKKPDGGKALLIEKPTVNGVISPFPVAINTMGSHKRMAMSLGANLVEDVAAELGSLMKAKPPTSLRETMKLLGQAIELRHARPKVATDGPCKEVIHKFDAPAPATSWPPAPDWRNPSTLNPQPSTSSDSRSRIVVSDRAWCLRRSLAGPQRHRHDARGEDRPPPELPARRAFRARVQGPAQIRADLPFPRRLGGCSANRPPR
ncbi:MAG: UbiD family decarboxylase [Verrucomicrobia bacterium]|nr:UbiD family decarboxylase [Verrucomicrobiota bacterium]